MVGKYVFCNDSGKRLVEYVLKVYPREACGLLLGRDAKIEKVKPVGNRIVDGEGKRHYQIDPMTIYTEEKEAAKEGLEILGVFHSHPDRGAVCSKEDETFMIPRMLYVIVSVSAGSIKEVKAFYRLTPGDGIKEAEIDKEV